MMARVLLSSLTIPLLFVAVLRGQASGQTIPSPYEFVETRQEAGIFAGALNPETGRFGYGPGSGVQMGVRYGIHLGGPFGLEGVAAYFPTTRDLIDPTRVEGDRKVGDPVDAEIVTVDARLRFNLTGDRTWRGLAPFIFIGAGMAFDRASETEPEAVLLEDDRFEFKNTFMALLGGGVRWFLTDRVLLRADGALSMWRLTSPNGFRDPTRGLERVGEKEWASGPSLTVGLSFHF